MRARPPLQGKNWIKEPRTDNYKVRLGFWQNQRVTHSLFTLVRGSNADSRHIRLNKQVLQVFHHGA